PPNLHAFPTRRSSDLALWDSIVPAYDLRPDEARMLADACREADIVQRLEDELADAPLMVQGSQGQLVASPLVSELRQHRSVLARSEEHTSELQSRENL